LLLAVLAGCDDARDLDAPRDAGAVADLSLAPDLRVVVALGGACRSSSECGGNHAFCLKGSGTDGYCSVKCQSDGDCADGMVCESLPSGAFCTRSCSERADCPSGFACFVDHTCASDSVLDCDPSKVACTTGDGAAGSCARFALGDGRSGECFPSCHLDQPCAPGRRCLVIDLTPYGEPFVEPLCLTGEVSPPIDDGEECLDGFGTPHFDYCRDGSECDLKTDLRCHKLCSPGTSFAVDGGKPCSCVDAFHLFGGANPVGLCE
jgi:hypothetical protein